MGRVMIAYALKVDSIKKYRENNHPKKKKKWFCILPREHLEMLVNYIKFYFCFILFRFSVTSEHFWAVLNLLIASPFWEDCPLSLFVRKAFPILSLYHFIDPQSLNIYQHPRKMVLLIFQISTVYRCHHCKRK